MTNKTKIYASRLMHFFLARTKIVNQNITQSIAMYSIKVVSKNSERMQIIYFNKVILENNLNFNIPILKNQKNSSNDE